MNRTKAAILARDLMDKHGFGHVPFEFDRCKTSLGRTFTNLYSQQVVKIPLGDA